MFSSMISADYSTKFYKSERGVREGTLGILARYFKSKSKFFFSLAFVKIGKDKTTGFLEPQVTNQVTFETFETSPKNAMLKLKKMIFDNDGKVFRSSGTGNRTDLTAQGESVIYEYISSEKNQERGCRKSVTLTFADLDKLADNFVADDKFNLGVVCGEIGLSSSEKTIGFTTL